MAPEDVQRAHGRRLTALRKIHGLTQADLAARLDVTQSFLSHIERGSRPLPDSLLLAASREFSLPAAFFAVPPSLIETGPVTFRKTSRAGARDEGRVTALYDEAARLFRAVSHGSGYRAADLPDPADYEYEPEAIAKFMREEAGLSADDPVLNVTRTLERFGIGVVDNLDHLDEGSRGHTGISRPSQLNDRPLVALTAELPGAVKRLTLLHEVCHLIFDRNLAEGITSSRGPEEQRAFRFAGAFLLPESVVRQRVSESLNLHGYLPIKADYGISVAAIVRRAREEAVISPGRYRSLSIQLSSQGWRATEPVSVADEKPLLLSQALSKAYGGQAVAKAAHDVGTAPAWIRQWTHAHQDTHPREPGTVIDLVAARAQAGRGRQASGDGQQMPGPHRKAFHR